MNLQVLFDDKTISAGTTERTSFSARNVQSIIIQVDAAVLGKDYTLYAQAGANVLINEVPLEALQFIAQCKRAQAFGALGDNVFEIDLGSVYLSGNEELELRLRNGEVSDLEGVDMILAYDSDDPEELYSYQKIIASNFSRQNVEEIFFFDSTSPALDENDSIITLTSETGKPAYPVKAAWMHTISSTAMGLPLGSDAYTGTNHKIGARVYWDDDELLQEVTVYITTLNSDEYFVAITNATTPLRNKKSIAEWKRMKIAKMNMIRTDTLALNAAKGRLTAE